MKKLIIAAFLACLIFCPSSDGFFSHKTIWASGDHFWFSLVGYKSVTPDHVKKSQTEAWWGDAYYLGTNQK
jgi:hypothetical protein